MDSSRSPRDVMVVVCRLGNKYLPQYASPFSRRDCACHLVLSAWAGKT